MTTDPFRDAELAHTATRARALDVALGHMTFDEVLAAEDHARTKCEERVTHEPKLAARWERVREVFEIELDDRRRRAEDRKRHGLGPHPNCTSMAVPVVSALSALRKFAEQRNNLPWLVHCARDAGASWQTIADVLGRSRQSVQQRFGGASAPKFREDA